MFKNKNLVLKLISTLAIIIIAVGAYFGYQIYKNSHTQIGDKEITIMVIYDNQVKTYNTATDDKFLGEVLDKEQLITTESSGFGRYITGVDGRVADTTAEEWWQVFVNSKASQVGIDDQAINDNDVILLILTTGYDG